MGLLGLEGFHRVANQGREGVQKQGRSSPESAALGQGPGSTSRDIHYNIFELLTELKPPTSGRC